MCAYTHIDECIFFQLVSMVKYKCALQTLLKPTKQPINKIYVERAVIQFNRTIRMSEIGTDKHD